MSDQKLRDLERRWKETGSPDDEAAYLLERVRVGDLSREKLELAAYCGHEGAGQATGVLPFEGAPDLVRWGEGVVVRAALSLSRRGLELWKQPPMPEDCRSLSNKPAAALEAAAEWVRCPCERHRRDANERSRRWEHDVLLAVNKRVARNPRPVLPAADPKLVSAGYLAFLAPRILALDPCELRRIIAESTMDNPPYSEAAISLDETKRILRADLADWALGVRDPVNEILSH